MAATTIGTSDLNRGERLRTALFLVASVGLMSLSPSATVGAAILVVLTVSAWGLGLFKEPVTSLLFFLAAILWHVAPLGVIFSGLESPAWWLVFGGSITGVAMRTTGLGAAHRVVARAFFRILRPLHRSHRDRGRGARIHHAVDYRTDIAPAADRAITG